MARRSLPILILLVWSLVGSGLAQRVHNAQAHAHQASTSHQEHHPTRQPERNPHHPSHDHNCAICATLAKVRTQGLTTPPMALHLDWPCVERLAIESVAAAQSIQPSPFPVRGPPA